VDLDQGAAEAILRGSDSSACSWTHRWRTRPPLATWSASSSRHSDLKPTMREAVMAEDQDDDLTICVDEAREDFLALAQLP